jgi:hypothetical protein
MPIFEVLVYFFAIKNIEECGKDLLKSKLNAIKEDFDSSGLFKNRVDSSTSVEYRFGEIEKLAGELPC